MPGLSARIDLKMKVLTNSRKSLCNLAAKNRVRVYCYRDLMKLNVFVFAKCFDKKVLQSVIHYHAKYVLQALNRDWVNAK